jgi:hypothetical protein
MSLDILKERFSGKLITSQYEDKIESKQKIIDKLEEETNNLSNQVVNLESEKNTLLQELNKARHFEDGAFSIKEKNYINKLQSKDLMIKEVEQKTNSLYKELDKKDERLIYKNKIIDNSLKTIKEAKNKINYLSVKLQNSKNSKKDLQLEIKKTYQDYIFKIDNFEKQIEDKNELINEQQNLLKQGNKELKKLTNTIQEIKTKNTNNKKTISELDNKLQQSKNSLIVENDKFVKEIDSKENTISELKSEVNILSNKVTALTETAQDKSILEKRLQEAEQFQEVVKNTKNNYNFVPKKKHQMLNTDNLIFKLKEIAKQKQGLKPLTWKQWIEIPESNYLNELNHSIAKKIFNENNSLFLEDERQQYDTHTRADIVEESKLVPLTIAALKGYYSSATLSDSTDEVNINEWKDLSGNRNHLTQDTANEQPEYNATLGSLQFKRGAGDLDHMDFTTGLTLSEFTLFFVLEFDDENRQVLLQDTDRNDEIEVNYINANRARLLVKANDGTDSVSTSILPDDDTIPQDTKLLLTCRKQPFNSDDGFGQVEWFVNKTSVGTNNDYDENILQTINELGNRSSGTGFEGNIYELAIYARAIDNAEITTLQNYFIDRTNINI